MKKKDKILLALLGIIIFIGGLIVAYGVYTYNYYLAYAYLPFKFLGLFFAYSVINRTPIKSKKDLEPSLQKFYDKKTDGFIQKNKSGFSIKIIILTILLTDIYLTINKNLYADSFNFGDAFSLIILYFFMLIGLGEGINFISASMTAKKKKR